MFLTLAACGEPAPVSTHVTDWRDQVIYQIVVDRFDDGDPSNDSIDGVSIMPGDLARFQGGDWQGVLDHLDYLSDLGVTALWISPAYRNIPRTEMEDGYHGYWPADFTEANARFGDMALLNELVRRCHERGMLVLLDVVPNHAGRVFDYDLNENGQVDPDEIEPPFSDTPYDSPLIWLDHPRMFRPGPEPTRFTLDASHFHRRGSGNLSDPVQKVLSDFPTGLRDLDSENQEVVDGLVESHVWWVEQTDVDGFRIDAVPHAPLALWQAFCGGLRERLAAIGKEDFLLLGEVFTADPATLARFTALDALDSAFAFDLKNTLINGVILEGLPPVMARGALADNRDLFPASGQPGGIGLDPWRARVTFGDNHDVWRLRGELDDPLAVQIALVAVVTVDGIPSIYYGTEQDLHGQEHHQAREPLWEVAGFSEETPTYQFIRDLLAIRRDSRALRHGDLSIRYLSESGGADEMPAADAGMMAWERAGEGERVLVVINSAVQTSNASFRTGFVAGTRLADALGEANAPWVVGQAGSLSNPLAGALGGHPRAALVPRIRSECPISASHRRANQGTTTRRCHSIVEEE